MYAPEMIASQPIWRMAAAGAVALMLAGTLAAQGRPAPTLIKGARIFDGAFDRLIGPMDVLVEDGRIARIAASIPPPAGAVVIDAKGRTMTTGFIDAHVHLSLQVNHAEISSLDEDYFAFTQADEAQKLACPPSTGPERFGHESDARPGD